MSTGKKGLVYTATDGTAWRIEREPYAAWMAVQVDDEERNEDGAPSIEAVIDQVEDRLSEEAAEAALPPVEVEHLPIGGRCQVCGRLHQGIGGYYDRAACAQWFYRERADAANDPREKAAYLALAEQAAYVGD